MLHKIVDVLKEVFWIKPSRKSRRKTIPAKKKRRTTAKPKSKKSLKPPQHPVLRKKASVTPGVKAVVKAPAKLKSAIDPSLTEVGHITHYFDRIKVCVVEITHGTILIGDKLTVIGAKTKFVQKVWSMQIESVDVKVAKKGQLIGLKVDKSVQVGDRVYK